MMRLRAVGQCVIEIGAHRVTPESDVLFALLLYLGINAGRSASRVELLRLLWPNCEFTSASHRLRQAIYQLRKAGAPIRTHNSAVLFDRANVEVDYASHVTRRQALVETLASAQRVEFLPHYAPTFSKPFAEWLECERDSVRAVLRRELHAILIEKRARGEHSDAIKAALACLDADPLNPDAIVALAEAHLLHGDAASALAVLDQYQAELSPRASEELRRLEQLRRRIAAISRISGVERSCDSPLVGRGDVVEQLTHWARHREQTRPRVIVLSGEAGIGKTRLLHEGVRLAALDGSQCLVYRPSSNGQERPLAGILDLLPKFLSLPGAAGCDPQSFSRLSNLARGRAAEDSMPEDVTDSAFRFALLRRAVVDLLAAILAESELVLAFDDAHCLDTHTLSILLDAARSSKQRLGLLIALRVRGAMAQFIDEQSDLQHIRVSALDAVSSRAIVLSHISARLAAPRDQLIDWAVDLANGNPFFLVELARHCCGANPNETLPASLQIVLEQKLDALSPTARLIVQACAILGENCTLARLDSVLALPPHATAAALSELDAWGLLDTREGRPHCRHDLIADHVVRHLGAAAAGYLHRRCAIVLDNEIQSSPVTTVAWDCILHWEAAGENDRALELTSPIADQLLRLGLPKAAADLCVRAERYCRTAEQHADRLLRLSHARRLLHDWDGVIDALEQRERLLKQTLPPVRRYSDDEFALLEARWSRSHDASVLKHALRGVVDAHAPGLHRLQMGVIGLIIADNFQKQREAELIAGVVESITPITPREDLEKMKARVVYHTAFGNLDAAVSAATRVVESERLTGSSAALMKALRWASVPLKYANNTDRAVSALIDCYAFSSRLGLRSEMWATAQYLTDLALDCEDVSLASEWAPICVALASEIPSATSFLSASSAYMMARTEVMRQNAAEARRLLDRARVDSSILRTRAEESLIALQVLLRLDGSEPVPRRLLHRLRWLHLRSRASGMRDFETGALLTGLVSVGEGAEAQRLLRQYISARRCRLPRHSVLVAAETAIIASQSPAA